MKSLLYNKSIKPILEFVVKNKIKQNNTFALYKYVFNGKSLYKCHYFVKITSIDEFNEVTQYCNIEPNNKKFYLNEFTKNSNILYIRPSEKEGLKFTTGNSSYTEITKTNKIITSEQFTSEYWKNEISKLPH